MTKEIGRSYVNEFYLPTDNVFPLCFPKFILCFCFLIKIFLLTHSFCHYFNLSLSLSLSLSLTHTHILSLLPMLQCNQNWPNFVTLAQFKKNWAHFEGLFSISQNFDLTHTHTSET